MFEKDKRISLFLLITLFFATIGLSPGCSFFGSKSANSANPVAPLLVSEPEPEIINRAASGTASLKVIIAFPDNYYDQQAIKAASDKSGTCTVGFKIAANLRASETAPYIIATLYEYVGVYPRIPEIVVRQKAFVSEGKAEIKISNLPEIRFGSIELELVGCHIQGFTKFQGSADILASTACEASVFPVTPEGALVTADYRLLSEIGINPSTYTEGPLTTAKITFNDLGEPIGWEVDNWVTNLITNQKYFNVADIAQKDPSWPASDFKITDIAYLNGSFYVGGGEVICKVNPDMQTKTIYAGQPGKFTPAKDGDSLASATLPVIRDMCVANGKIYLNSNMDTVVELGDNIGVYRDVITGLWGSRVSVTENGDIFFVGHIQNLKCSVLKFTGKNTYVKVGPDEDYPNQQTSLISYQGGYLIANENYITQVFADGSSRIWLDINYPSGQPKFYIYKNAQGKIYVVADQLRKIWEVK